MRSYFIRFSSASKRMAYFNILMIFVLICPYIGLIEVVSKKLTLSPVKPRIHLLKGAALELKCVYESSEKNTSSPNFLYSNSISGSITTSDVHIKNNVRGISILTMEKALSDGSTTTTTTLTKNETVFNDTGVYTCQVGDSTSRIDVFIFAVSGEGADLLTDPPKNVTLECKLDSLVDMDNYEIHWKHIDVSKNTKDLVTGEKYKINNGSLMIHNPGRSDMGDYLCVYIFDKDSIMDIDTVTPKPVQLRAGPRVDYLDNNKTMVQGEEVDIRCEVSGFPLPDVMWLKDGVTLNSSQRIHFLHSDKHQVKIYSLDFSDEGEYTCYAKNPVNPFNDTKTMRLRVKDKLAALWPFLGIVAEVIILCAIILIYEKRRSKKLADEDDAPDSNLDNTVDHKDKDVRHRKT